MKLLTLNTHSVVDEFYDLRINVLRDFIIKHKPDVIALQEVMQISKNKTLNTDHEIKTIGEIAVKEKNPLIDILKGLENHRIRYNCIYSSFKKAYGIYDEGVALLSSKEISSYELVQLSSFNNYDNYKTRFAIGIKIDNTWFYSVHFNWENDDDSPFLAEWKNLEESIKDKKNVYIMGDFNITPSSKSYEYISKKYFDTYMLAKDVDNGITVKGEIDGWNKRKENNKRIDYIFTNKNTEYKSSRVVFNGKNEEIISDHFGVFLEKEQG